MKTLILSDLHLGPECSSAANLLDGLRGVARGFDRVILNGDTLDRCEPDLSLEPTERLLKDARDACSSRAGPPEILSGNHDPFVSETDFVYLAESATLIFHGDCIADCTHPTKPEERLMAAHFARRWAALGGRPGKFSSLAGLYRREQANFMRGNPPPPRERKSLAYLLHVFFPPLRPIHVLEYWRRAPGLVARLAATFEEPVRHAVFGHTHRAGRWNIAGMTVFNTGSFMPLSRPHAVIAEGSSVQIRPLAGMLRTGRTVLPPMAHKAALEERA